MSRPFSRLVAISVGLGLFPSPTWSGGRRPNPPPALPARILVQAIPGTPLTFSQQAYNRGLASWLLALSTQRLLTQRKFADSERGDTERLAILLFGPKTVLRGPLSPLADVALPKYGEFLETLLHEEPGLKDQEPLKIISTLMTMKTLRANLFEQFSTPVNTLMGPLWNIRYFIDGFERGLNELHLTKRTKALLRQHMFQLANEIYQRARQELSGPELLAAVTCFSSLRDFSVFTLILYIHRRLGERYGVSFDAFQYFLDFQSHPEGSTTSEITPYLRNRMQELLLPRVETMLASTREKLASYQASCPPGLTAKSILEWVKAQTQPVPSVDDVEDRIASVVEPVLRARYEGVQRQIPPKLEAMGFSVDRPYWAGERKSHFTAWPGGSYEDWKKDPESAEQALFAEGLRDHYAQIVSEYWQDNRTQSFRIPEPDSANFADLQLRIGESRELVIQSKAYFAFSTILAQAVQRISPATLAEEKPLEVLWILWSDLAREMSVAVALSEQPKMAVTVIKMNDRPEHRLFAEKKVFRQFVRRVHPQLSPQTILDLVNSLKVRIPWARRVAREVLYPKVPSKPTGLESA